MRALVSLLFLGFGLAALAPAARGQEIPALTADGFAVPRPDPVFAFPRDHGAHPDYKIEWWYLTGHLYADEGPVPRRFGFQATFSAPPRPAASRPARVQPPSATTRST